MKSYVLRGVYEHIYRCRDTHNNASKDNRHHTTHQELYGDIRSLASCIVFTCCVLNGDTTFCPITVGYEPHGEEHCNYHPDTHERVQPVAALDLNGNVMGNRVDVGPARHDTGKNQN